MCLVERGRERAGGRDGERKGWMEGGRRGLILPGLWDKLVPGSRKRYAGHRRSKSCYPSILLSIQEHICDREPHGFVFDVCEVSRGKTLKKKKKRDARKRMKSVGEVCACVLLGHSAALG